MAAVEPERVSVVLEKETPDHFRRDDPQYQTKFANFYPTAAVDFFKTKDRPIGHDNTAQPLKNVVIAEPGEHYEVEPEECTYCEGLEIENKILR